MMVLGMAVKNPRINVAFGESDLDLFTILASQEKKSIASLVRELTLEALELREDLYLSKAAAKLDGNNVNAYTHNETWE